MDQESKVVNLGTLLCGYGDVSSKTFLDPGKHTGILQYLIRSWTL